MSGPGEYGIVEWYGSGSGHRCGYCKSSNGNISDGMWSHSLTVQNYQDLIDRGWRRSGKYCYKPIMNKTCCPHYTIKMAALDFKMNKSHKKIIKHVNKYLIHGIKPSDSKTVHDEARDVQHEESGNVPKGEQPDVDRKQEKSVKDDEAIQATKPGEKSAELEDGETVDQSRQSDVKDKKMVKKGDGADPNKPPCRKAKEMRLEKKKDKLLKAGKSPEEIEEILNKKSTPAAEKTLEEYLEEPSKAENCAHKLEIKLIRSNPRQHAAFVDSYKESHLVFKKYQMVIHHEDASDCGQESFDNFLVDSPLKECNGEGKKNGRVSMGYGSFHQHYILDGKIIAVGVIDILPYCISSVYLYYHPDYSFLALGTYSALQEIAFTRHLNTMDKELKYYYMGYYIHSCPKMRYKGQYYPSFLSCPETYTWQPIEKCTPKLDENKYSRFAPEGVKDDNLHVSDDDIYILFMRQMMTYTLYKQLNPKHKDSKTVKKYSQLVGKRAASQIMLFRSD